jgi:hypothetical protein
MLASRASPVSSSATATLGSGAAGGEFGLGVAGEFPFEARRGAL